MGERRDLLLNSLLIKAWGFLLDSLSSIAFDGGEGWGEEVPKQVIAVIIITPSPFPLPHKKHGERDLLLNSLLIKAWGRGGE